MDRTIGPLDYFFGQFFGSLFWTIFGPFFWTILSRGVHTFSTQGRVGYTLSVLREGWEPDCCYSGRSGRRTISTQGAVGGGCIYKCYWLMQFSLDHSKCLSGSSTDYFYVKMFLAGLLPWAVLLSCERETATRTLDFIDWTSYWKYGQLSSLILHCWVMRVPFESACFSAKWHSPVVTYHLSVASRFPLCGQYIITKFISLPLAIDFIRQKRSRNLWSLALNLAA